MICRRGPRWRAIMIRHPRRRRRGGDCSNIRVYRGDVGAIEGLGHDAGALRRADLRAVHGLAGVRAGRRLRRPGARVLHIRSVHRTTGPGPALARRRLGGARPAGALFFGREDADEQAAAALDGQALVPAWKIKCRVRWRGSISTPPRAAACRTETPPSSPWPASRRRTAPTPRERSACRLLQSRRRASRGVITK